MPEAAVAQVEQPTGPRSEAAERPAPRPPRPPPSLPEPVEEPPEEGAPAWTTTFGDMMSLLLTFFILLFSMSTVEVEKFRAAAKSLHEGFGEAAVDAGLQSPAPPPVADSGAAEYSISSSVEEKMEEISQALEGFVAENGLEQNVVVDRTDEGVYLRIRDVALFEPGGAEIEGTSAWIVEKLEAVLTAVDMPVTVAGYTDDVPISNSRFQSNWELSAARAAGIARMLVSVGHDAAAIQVTAFGEYRPIDTNETAEGRARNRRVELFYARQSIEDTLLERQRSVTEN